MKIKYLFFIIPFLLCGFTTINSNNVDTVKELADFLEGEMQTDYFLYGQQYTEMGTTTLEPVDKVFSVTGEWSYVLGIDLHTALTPNQIPDSWRNILIRHIKKGGVVTASWHPNNFVTGGSRSDLGGNPVVNILEGGSHRSEFLAELDRLAEFFNAMRNPVGTVYPVIFRPWHENDGNWFWWGRSTCTAEQFIQLWQDTIDYLVTTKGVNNLLICYSPQFGSPTESIARYPGDNYVDIIAADKYNNTVEEVIPFHEASYDFAVSKGKIYAVEEGMRNLETNPDADYWTDTFTKLRANSKTNKAAYVTFWTGGSWGVNPGRTSDIDDFISAWQQGLIKLLKYEENGMKVY